MTSKKSVVVIYKGNDWDRKIPITSTPTRESFQDWHERGIGKNILMYRASISWFDAEKGIFKKAWAYRNKQWIKIEKPIKPDLIFDKVAGSYDYVLFAEKMKISEKVKIFNTPLFRVAVDNKLSQYLILGEFMPKSFAADSVSQLEEALKNIGTQKVVIKPLYGSGGKGIIIEEKKNIKLNSIEFPVLAQEFIQGAGIPNFTRKGDLADLRLIFMNHKLVYALSRIAKRGSLFTNFHQGATAVLVPEESIPKIISQPVKKIIHKLSVFPEAHYSLDFIFDQGGKPYLVEMNTTPGFDLLQIVGNEKIKNKNFTEFMKVID